MTQPSTHPREKRQAAPNPTNLLSIPRELRNQIYSQLLIVDRFQIQIHPKSHHLQLEILRVCRKTYEEGKEILYGQNCWIKVTMDQQIRKTFNAALHIARKRTSWVDGAMFADFPFVDLNEGSFSNFQPSLEIRLVKQAKHSKSFSVIAVSLAAMPRFCRLLSQKRILSTPATMQLSFMQSVRQRFCTLFSQERILSAPAAMQSSLMHSVRQRWEDDILCCLREAYGCAAGSTVNIRGFDSSATHDELTSTFQRGLTHSDYVLRLVSAYQARASRQIDPYESRCTYLDGMDYLDDLLCHPLGLWPTFHSRFYTGINDSQLQKLQDIGMAMTFKFARICIELGDSEYAVEKIQHNVTHWDPHLEFLESSPTNMVRYGADVYFHYALAHLAQGRPSKAISFFQKALVEKPGTEMYDAAVDRLEMQLEGSERAEDQLTLQDIREKLEPHRHQTASVDSSGRP